MLAARSPPIICFSRQRVEAAARRPRRGAPPACCASKAPPSTTSRNIDVDIPLERLVCVTGVSGSGKSTLVHDVLFPALQRAKGKPTENPGRHRGLAGRRTDRRRGHGRSEPHRPHHALQSRELCRRLRCHPRLVRQIAAGSRAQVHRRHLQFQCRQRPLPGLRRQRLRARRDAISLGCVPALPRLRRPALSGGDSRVQVGARRLRALEHRRRARPHGLRSAGGFSRPTPRSACALRRSPKWGSIICGWANPYRRSRAAKRSG